MRMDVKSIAITSVEFSLNKEIEQLQEKLELHYTIEVEGDFDLKKKELCVYLKIKTPTPKETQNSPIYFNVITKGVFQLEEEPNEKILEQFRDINCPAIIFPYVRELIADLTRRADLPPLHLPTVNFIQMKHDSRTEKPDHRETDKKTIAKKSPSKKSVKKKS